MEVGLIAQFQYIASSEEAGYFLPHSYIQNEKASTRKIFLSAKPIDGYEVIVRAHSRRFVV
jgi:hypothetical protein